MNYSDYICKKRVSTYRGHKYPAKVFYSRSANNIRDGNLEIAVG